VRQHIRPTVAASGALWGKNTAVGLRKKLPVPFLPVIYLRESQVAVIYRNLPRGHVSIEKAFFRYFCLTNPHSEMSIQM
jgi:hypothetical protein